jgi:hypothetical protein
MKTKPTLLAVLSGFTAAALAATPDDGSVLPFPPTPMSASVAKPLHFTSNATFDIGTDLGFARVARLLRPGAVCLQRHHWKDDDQISEEINIQP